MIHLLGIDHKFQVMAFRPFVKGGVDECNSQHLARDFERYLDNLLDSVEIQVVAEEYSYRNLEILQVTDPQAYLVAQGLCQTRTNITHIACDPDQSERDTLYAYLNTSEAQDKRNGYPIRESEWLKRISSFLPSASLLFICGAKHIATFTQKLHAAGARTSIICKDLSL